MWDAIKDHLSGKVPLGKTRSGKWARLRANHLYASPNCILCGSNKKVEVHHIFPFHLHPELELEPTNLISLCENKTLGGVNCHLLFGHLGNFKSFNVNVIKDCLAWKQKIKNRP